jgi:hypothetical protein
MKRYLLSTQQPDGPPPSSVDMEGVARAVAALEQEMKTAGVWVFNDHLLPPDTAKVVRVVQGGKLRTRDGPYRKSKEHVGGLSIIEAPDLETALVWGGKLARATTLPIEVRPFQREVEDR